MASGRITRPQTVILNQDNIRRLQRYPRPPRDNGIGLHFHLDLRDQFIAETIQHLQEIRATWTLIFAQDELQTERAARACFAAGIMPVVRIGKLIDEFTEPAAFVEGLRRAWKSAGWGGPVEPLYVQLWNEPEDPREWVAQATPPDGPLRFAQKWAADAPKIVDAGGFVGIQVLTREPLARAVDAIAARHAEGVWERAFFVHHNYGQNHPPTYPYDAIKQQTDPGTTIIQDDTAALRFLAHAAWMQEMIGFVLPVIGGEGGWWLFNDEDKHYPKVETPLHAQYTKEMYEWLATGVLSNGEATPDYLFSITSWIAGSWTFGAQNWWGNLLSPTGRLDETIEAMRSIPAFTRQFSWDDAGGESVPGGGAEPPSQPDPVPHPVPQPVPGPQPAPQPIPMPEPTPAPVPQPQPEPLPEPTPAPSPVDWDPRLDALGVCLDPAGADATWRLVKAEFWDEERSQGKHHIYVRVVRANGEPAPGIPCVADWVGRHPDQLPVRGTTDFNGETNLPMFVSFDPTLKNGNMFATVEGARADVMRGMGLPFNHHVCFVLTYKEA